MSTALIPESRRTFDLIIVGAGVAGLGAALTAGESGADVLVIDAAEQVGGAAATAGGGTCIAGSPRQTELGIVDGPEAALEDWCTFGGPSVDVSWAERYLRAAVGELWELLASVGVRFGDVTWNEGNRVPRWHAPVGGGRAVMSALEARARTFPNIRWALDTRVTGLVVEAGSVRGVTVMPVSVIPRQEPDVVSDAGSFELRARVVVIATGGFTNDVELVRTHAERVHSAPTVLLGGGRGARGEGLRMLAAVHAATVNLDAVWMYPYGLPDDRDPGSGRGLAVRGLDGEIWVNRAGHRFHDETRRGGASGTPALLAQDGATCWAIVDARIAAGMSIADSAYRTGSTPDRSAIAALLQRSPWIASADDLPALGERAGVDAAALVRTVAEHNRACAMGGTDEFGRDVTEAPPIVTPPFHAVRFFPLARKNLGGIRTDADTRVLDTKGRVVPGLHAVGEVAGMAGGSINGRAALEGTMFGPCLFSGVIAGRSSL